MPELETGVTFKIVGTSMVCTVGELYPATNEIEVCITNENDMTWSEVWNFEHTVVGFNRGAYVFVEGG